MVFACGIKSQRFFLDKPLLVSTIYVGVLLNRSFINNIYIYIYPVARISFKKRVLRFKTKIGQKNASSFVFECYTSFFQKKTKIGVFFCRGPFSVGGFLSVPFLSVPFLSVDFCRPLAGFLSVPFLARILIGGGG